MDDKAIDQADRFLCRTAILFKQNSILLNEREEKEELKENHFLGFSQERIAILWNKWKMKEEMTEDFCVRAETLLFLFKTVVFFYGSLISWWAREARPLLFFSFIISFIYDCYSVL